MYTILLKTNKSLICNQDIRLYQGQALVDSLQFIIPKIYDTFDLSQYADLSEENVNKSFSAYLNIISPTNEVTSYLLTTDYDTDGTTVLPYKTDFMRFAFPLEASITKSAGNTKIQLTISWSDLELRKDYVLKSSEFILTTLPLDDYYSYISNDALSAIDNKILELQHMIDELRNVINNSSYSETDIPDNNNNSGDNNTNENNTDENNDNETNIDDTNNTSENNDNIP